MLVVFLLLRALLYFFFFFFFNDTATTEIYTLSLHDALPICGRLRSAHQPNASQRGARRGDPDLRRQAHGEKRRSEEHTSELQSPCNLVCRLLLEKKKKKKKKQDTRKNTEIAYSRSPENILYN